MTSPVILPGATLGILGSGQLGRMLALAAKRMGYRVHVFSPDEDTPAGQVADLEIRADYQDADALRRFAEQTDVVTIEFENIPVAALEIIQEITPVYPQPHVLYVTQHRLRERQFLSEQGIPVSPYQAAYEANDLESGFRNLQTPLVLKAAGFGYDGKWQAKVNTLEEALRVFKAWEETPSILEEFVNLKSEISVIGARTEEGFAAYRPVENAHRNHILELTLAPADIDTELEQKAVGITRHIMEAFEMRGLLCVEFFITRDGRLLVNELAPRPHNSGHYTMEAAFCSQFEQQLRAVCGLPLGGTGLHHAAAMMNLLGDRWEKGEPDWRAALNFSPVYLHLYGKKEARPGRKMGHLTALADTVNAAEALVRQASEVLH